MPAQEFDCPQCGQRLEVDELATGGTLECPSCKGVVELPSSSAPASSSPVTAVDPGGSPNPPGAGVKKCPFCGEEILAVAVKCKHCGEFLAGGVLRFGADGRVKLGRSSTPALPRVDFDELPPHIRGGVRHRVMLFGETPTMPELCVVTGETATMESAVPRFLWGSLRGSPYLFVWQFHRQPISLPFSPKGLAAYKQKRTFFSLLLEGGLLVARHVPILPLDIMWLCVCCVDFCWLILIDRGLGRRNLCWAHWKNHIVTPEREFDVSVVSREFADEFLRLNPSAIEPMKGHAYRLGFCRHCGTQVPIYKKRCNHILHGILTFFTYFIWAIVWIGVARSGQWFCAQCGGTQVSKAQPKT